MLTTIIKRDGSKEAFIPGKLNKWSEWASEDLKGRVDWSSVVINALRGVGEVIDSQALQELLIKECIRRKNWAYNMMAGRLFAVVLRKEIFGETMPSVKTLVNDLWYMGGMRKLNYTDDEFSQIEQIIDHKRDFEMAHFQLKQIVKKYAIRNETTKVFYETPQYVYMRMAMALAEDEADDVRMEHLKNWYNHFSMNRINAPTPNYMNLGTTHNGYASCCLYTTDDNARSLAIGDHIAYTMTYMSAGIGGYINSRSMGDSVRAGKIEHQGKMPYFDSLAGAVKANLQGGRGGACTTYFNCFDPEAASISMLQNPLTPVDKQNRKIHFCFNYNYFFATKVAKNEQIFTFNISTAPDLVVKFFSEDREGFAKLYQEYEDNPDFVKNYVSARDLLVMVMVQREEVATLYTMQIDEVNRHTSFFETIYSGNLCVEITQPTSPYQHMMDLYSVDHERGEVSLCNIAGLVVSRIHSDEVYESAAFYALRMIDKCIHMSDYELPHVGYTAKKRMNAGIGIVGLAEYMARKNLKYNSAEGLAEIHRVSEKHAFFIISASLKLGQELGNAPWMHKTKWPSGWLPIDTYKRTIDTVANPGLQYAWEPLRAAIIANKGIRNSSLIAHMPTESSSKASGAPNSLYPVRDLSLKKSDAKNVLDWCAPDNDILEDSYQLAWELSHEDMCKVYGVVQKFSDQSISADYYTDRVAQPFLKDDDLIKNFLNLVKYGNKSQYYQNSYTVESDKLSEHEIKVLVPEAIPVSTRNERAECAGACSL